MVRYSLALASLIAAWPSLAAIPEPSGIARHLRASAEEEPAFMLSASGTNLFQCMQRADAPNAYSWSFVAPNLTLFEGARTAGSHSAASRFDSVSDRTSVFTQLRATQPGGADNMPWAKMRAVPAGESGMFAGVTTIQRVNTSGGVAPANGCDAATAGNETRVNFSADYYFYKRRGTS